MSYAEPSVVCAWCGELLRLAGESISHGICPACSARFERDAALPPGRRGRGTCDPHLRRRHPRRRQVAIQLWLPLAALFVGLILTLPV